MATEKRSAFKRLVWIFFALVLVLLLVVAFKPKPQPADFVGLERGPLQVSIDEEGETRVRDRFVVSAPLSGRVLRIELEPGDEVVANETVLATFQPSDPSLLDARSQAEANARVKAAEAALGLAKSERQRAAAQLRFAEAELTRIRRLAADNIVSAERLDTAELEVETRQEAVNAANYSVRNAEHELERARAARRHGHQAAGGDEAGPIVLRSPIDGVVLRRLRESESVVPAGEPLLEVADPGQLEIVADYLSTDAVRIDRGDPVLIEQWGGDRPLQGKVRRVEPSGFTKISALGVEEQRVNVVIDFADPQEAWKSLGDGFRVEVRVIVWHGDDVLKVPTSALFRSGDQWAVFVVDGDHARLRTLELGQRSSLEAEVLGGLDADDRVIAHPSDTIVDGIAVTERTL